MRQRAQARRRQRLLPASHIAPPQPQQTKGERRCHARSNSQPQRSHCFSQHRSSRSSPTTGAKPRRTHGCSRTTSISTHTRQPAPARSGPISRFSPKPHATAYKPQRKPRSTSVRTAKDARLPAPPRRKPLATSLSPSPMSAYTEPSPSSAPSAPARTTRSHSNSPGVSEALCRHDEKERHVYEDRDRVDR